MNRIKTYQLDEIEFIKKYRRINHIGLPKIVNIAIKPTHIDVEFEYINGIEIGEYYLNELSSEEIEADFYKLCHIINELHKVNIIHRDIKPSNIIKGFDGEIYLIDFGISRVFNNQKSKDTKIFGTEYYAAPEQYGFSQTDERTCIYQIGATFKELTTNQNVSRALKIKIDKCSKFDPIHRYQSINEIINITADNRFWRYFALVSFHALCIAIAIDCITANDFFNFFFYLFIMPITDLLILYYSFRQKSKPQKLGTIIWKIALIAIIVSCIISDFASKIMI